MRALIYNRNEYKTIIGIVKNVQLKNVVRGEDELEQWRQRKLRKTYWHADECTLRQVRIQSGREINGQTDK